MKLPRDLSGKTLAACLCRKWAYVPVHQVGSHIILQTDTPSTHRITVPAHDALRIGTLNAILRDVARHKGIDRQNILDSL